MSTSTINCLSDVGSARIAKIVVVAHGGQVQIYSTLDEITDFIADYGLAEVQWLDGLWCSVNPRSDWLNFHVELKR